LPEEDDEEFEDESEEEDEEFEDEESEDFSVYTHEELQDLAAKAATLKAKGNELFIAKQLPDALDLYSQAIATCPSVEPFIKDKAIYYGNRSATFVKLFRFKEAVADCTKALDIDPNYLKVLIRRASAYEELEMLEEAYEDYKHILQLDPNNFEAQKCSRLLEAVLSDDGTGCINSDMIQTALTNMMAKAAQRREQQLELNRIQGGNTNSQADELVFEEKEKQKEIREKIIQCVDDVKAYFPHPSHPIYFIRMLEKMKLEPNSKWFPWGTPPVSQMKTHLPSLDSNGQQYFQETITALTSQ